MKIAISNNWIYDDRWWVYRLFQKYFNNQVELVNDPVNCDILLYSTFGDEDYYKNSLAKYKIFCSWETRFYIDITNERMPYADLALTYMPTEGKNLRVPMWYHWIDWWNSNLTNELTIVCGQSHHYIGNGMLPSQYVPSPENIESNIYSSESVLQRSGICAMLVGNCEPDSLSVRKNIYKDFSENIGPVVGYGSAFGKRFEGNKIDLLKNFRYNLCFENSVHEGYVTEKLFDAKFAGCIPLYYGDVKYSEIDFNKKCFLNRLDFSDNADFLKQVKLLEENNDAFIEKANEPLFSKIPTIDYIYERFDEVFK